MIEKAYHMEKQIYFNGGFYPENQKLISILDRGLCFGDGLFEVIRCIDGKFVQFTKHLNRLQESSSMLQIDFPYSSDELLVASKELSSKNNICDGELYLQITRGEAPRYHLIPENVSPNFFMALNPLRSININCWSEGVSVCTISDIRGGLCHLKTINLLPHILGKEEAKKNGGYEAIFIRETSSGKYISEGTSSSYFGVKNNRLYTPELDNILPGTTREAVINLAIDNNIKVIEKKIFLNDYLDMDEAFLTSTVSDVMPVVKIDNQIISNGKPGQLTLFLQKFYSEYILNNLE
jgi:D-alanine transaminase